MLDFKNMRNGVSERKTAKSSNSYALHYVDKKKKIKILL